MNVMQSALRLIYPDQCASCGEIVDSSHGLCPDCWRETPFILGYRCRLCSQPLLGEGAVDEALCDACLETPRPWVKGHAPLVYEGVARRIVLALKHGDRTDLAKPAARWMVKVATETLSYADLIVPVPIHWTRRLSRRYNQSAELGRELSVLSHVDHRPCALERVRRTATQDGMTIEERRRNMIGSIVPAEDLTGKRIILVDDVMTSGATLEVATQACHAAGASQVSVLVLARVAKDA